MVPAKIATPTKVQMMASPTTAMGERRTSRVARRHGPLRAGAGADGTVAGSATVAGLTVPNASTKERERWGRKGRSRGASGGIGTGDRMVRGRRGASRAHVG